jgi:hypothetical protein
VLTALCGHFPPTHASNSPKQILLLHELQKLLERAPPPPADGLAGVLSAFLPVYVKSVASDNYRVAERALQFWESDAFVTLATATPV